MSVMIRPRMPMLTVQYWRISTTSTPAVRQAVMPQLPKLANWNSMASAWMPMTTQGNTEMMPMMEASRLTAGLSNLMPSRSGWVVRLNLWPQVQARLAMRYMAVTPRVE
jgi:hypothetical protein